MKLGLPTPDADIRQYFIANERTGDRKYSHNDSSALAYLRWKGEGSSSGTRCCARAGAPLLSWFSAQCVASRTHTKRCGVFPHARRSMLTSVLTHPESVRCAVKLGKGHHQLLHRTVDTGCCSLYPIILAVRRARPRPQGRVDLRCEASP